MATETTFIQFAEGSAPSTPASTKWRVYFKTDGIYVIDDAGNETGPLGAGGGAALGAWTDYTPTLTASSSNPTLGSSTVSGRYKQLDASTYIVQCNLGVNTGGGWNAGSGEYRFSLPSGLTASGGRQALGSLHVLDAATRRYTGTAMVGSGNAYVGPLVLADASADHTIKHNSPVTWATGDQIDVQVIVEVS